MYSQGRSNVCAMLSRCIDSGAQLYPLRDLEAFRKALHNPSMYTTTPTANMYRSCPMILDACVDYGYFQPCMLCYENCVGTRLQWMYGDQEYIWGMNLTGSGLRLDGCC
jgi:hypothetical protein